MEMYDIGLVVVTTYNYGNDMTNYSLYDYLKSLGYRVMFINVPWNEMCYVPHYCNNKLGWFLEYPISTDSLPTEYESRWDILELNNRCKMFIVGSDQLWNNSFISRLKYYTCLDWVRTEKYKIAYSTSTGNGFADLDIRKLLTYLKRFQKIGLREQQAVECFNKEYGLNAIHVLDPVFLHSKAWYQKIAKKGMDSIREGCFLGAYLLDNDRWKQEFVNEVMVKCEYLKKIIVSLPVSIKGTNKNDGVCRDLKTEEWLAFIEKSDFFITDSFHGVCFSLIFQKQFLVLFNKNSERGLDRITSLLKMLGLEERLITDESKVVDIDLILNKRIDYTSVEQILDKKVQEHKAWLVDAINDGLLYLGEEDSYDVFTNEYYGLCKKLEMSMLACQKMRMERWLQYQKEEYGIEKMVIWGAGGCFLDHINEIKKIYMIDSVFDRDERKWGEEYCPGIACLPPEKIVTQQKVIVLIMAYSEAIYKEVKKKLLEKGINNSIGFNEWKDLILKI